MKKSRILGGLLLLLLPALSLSAQVNYAEALQKSLYYYDAARCGTEVSEGWLPWRGDCHVGDQVSSVVDRPDLGILDISGGFHDYGNHVKSASVATYSAATLGWSFYEFREAFVRTGEEEKILQTLKEFNDYLMKCSILDEAGVLKSFVLQVGNNDEDNSYWGPPELQSAPYSPRKVKMLSDTYPDADVVALAAASLALMHLNYKTIDPVYSGRCLRYALALYNHAHADPRTSSNGFYLAPPPAEDDLAFAAIWLYRCTGEVSYLNRIDAVGTNGNYTGYLRSILLNPQSTWQNRWTYSLYDIWAGVFVLLSGIIPERTDYDYFSRWNLEYFSSITHQDAPFDSYLPPTQGGFAVLNVWGSARYNAAAQLCALVYAKYHPGRSDFTEWARGQMSYILGANPLNLSYLIGYGENYPQHPHHQAAHGSLTNSMADPQMNKHILWGALVGGPDTDDVHVDEITDYVYNEVSIEYNAPLVGALAGLYLLYGQDTYPDPAFPPWERKPGTVWLEFPKNPVTPGYPFTAEVHVNTGGKMLAAYNIHFSFGHEYMDVYYSPEKNAIEAADEGFLSAVGFGSNWNFIASGFDVSGKGPSSDLHLLNITFMPHTCGTSKIQVTTNSMSDSQYVSLEQNPAVDGYVYIYSNGITGDVNQDGIVTIVDALIVAQFYTIKSQKIFLDTTVSDVNKSGRTDIVDALMIAQYGVGMISSF